MANDADEKNTFQPFVSDQQTVPELTLQAVLLGAILGILFGASSMYLVLKVGLTVSASIPVAVLAFAGFRMLTVFGMRKSSILENNIVQTTGSAGESISFAVGLCLPALLPLGFDIDEVRVMTIGVLGSLLGILMMIPLRRVFIVKKHHELKYPEGTACADVLIAGEKGGATARMVFVGFGIGFVYQFLMNGLKLWKNETHVSLSTTSGAGLKGGAIGCEMLPALLGVGYIIGPRIASIMVAGGVLAYLVIAPTIVYFGENLTEPLAPAVSKMEKGVNVGLIRNMSDGAIRSNYILYIGAGAVATGGIISMLQALPVILSSISGALRDLRGAANSTVGELVRRTDRDLPLSFVFFGSIGLVLAVFLAPSLGLGLNVAGIFGAIMILLFGFLFVTVSSRLTGEIGSSSNPISGMTVATLLLTCLVLVGLSELQVIEISKATKLLALTVAGVVCVACSNGGTTSQALKTGHLVGATPLNQQIAILVGSLCSALVVGLVLLAMNQAGTTYSKKNLPDVKVDVSALTVTERVKIGEYASDPKEYKVLNIGDGEKVMGTGPIAVPNDAAPGTKPTIGPVLIPSGRYLVNDDGSLAYLVDPAVNGKLKESDNGEKATNKFEAPKTQLIALIINGIFDRNLPWGLVLIGVLVSLTMELCGVPSLPFAVGVYLPLGTSVPIFLGGMIRALTDKIRPKNGSADGDSSPGVLLSSGYIAGGSIMAVILAFMAFQPAWLDMIDLTNQLNKKFTESNTPAYIAFGVLILVLLVVGSERLGKKTGSDTSTNR